MKREVGGRSARYCQTCRHFVQGAIRRKSGSEWGTCLRKKLDVHLLEEEQCHSDLEVAVQEMEVGGR